MATDHNTWRGIWSSTAIGACLVAFACAVQGIFAPTVTVTCPAHAQGAPDCEMRWLVAFDLIPVRRTALPGLHSVGQVVESNPGAGRSSSGPNQKTASAGAYTVYLQTAAGSVRTILWGNRAADGSDDVAEQPPDAEGRERHHRGRAAVLDLAAFPDRRRPSSDRQHWLIC